MSHIFVLWKYIQANEGHRRNTFVQFCSGLSRPGSSGLFLNKTAKTSLFRNSYFIRMINVWNALPVAIRSEVKVVPFKKKLKSYFYERLSTVFYQDNIRSYKLVCLECRRANTVIHCYCYFFLLLYFFWFAIIIYIAVLGNGILIFKGMVWWWVYLEGEK